VADPDGEILYGDLTFYHTHPAHVAAVAGLRGLPVPPVETCRVLEVGCGTGFNLLAMSRSLPNARFVGVDLSEPQVAHGRAMAAKVGATNIELRAGGLESLDDSLGEFDYVIAHGVFSWVPPDVRAALLTLYRRRLAPHGVGYVSFNTYPGWHFRGMLRDIMLLFLPPDAPPREQLRVVKERTRQFLAGLPDPDVASARILKAEFERADKSADYYVLGEFLTPHNRPMLFTEFAALLADHGLRFLAESRFGTNSFAQLGDDRRALEAADDDLVRCEQYLDHRVHGYFRESLIVPAGAEPSKEVDAGVVLTFSVHAGVEPVGPPGDPDATEFDAVRRGDEALEVRDPLYRRVLRRLWAADSPLVPAAAFRPDVVAVVGFDVGDAAILPLLAKVLVKGFSEELWLFAAAPPAFAATPGDRPTACPLARLTAGETVTNRLHRPVPLTPDERAVLTRLDGRTTRGEIGADAVIAKLAKAALLEG
jgi:SAM-dependent methyltransferase